MSAVFETETLDKSRRSLMIVAWIVIGLNYVTLASDRVSIFGLEVLVDLDQLLIAGKVATIYVCGRFILWIYIDASRRRGSFVEENAKELLERIRNSPDDEPESRRIYVGWGTYGLNSMVDYLSNGIDSLGYGPRATLKRIGFVVFFVSSTYAFWYRVNTIWVPLAIAYLAISDHHRIIFDLASTTL